MNGCFSSLWWSGGIRGWDTKDYLRNCGRSPFHRSKQNKAKLHADYAIDCRQGKMHERACLASGGTFIGSFLHNLHAHSAVKRKENIGQHGWSPWEKGRTHAEPTFRGGCHQASRTPLTGLQSLLLHAITSTLSGVGCRWGVGGFSLLRGGLKG